jgi:uncharacterized protein YegL
MAQMIFNPGQFTTQKAKPLPIFLLLDTSGSMDIVTNPDEVRRTGQTGFVDGNQVEFVEGGITRISVLNEAVKKMLHTLAKYERDATEFLIGIVTFGADTRLLLPLSPAGDVRFTDLEADGETPLAKALEITKKIIEDKGQVPSRSFRPLIVLVSDGEPDAGWEKTFDDFIKNGRSAKCDRMALAISQEANRDMLAKFVEGTGHSVFEAETAEQITEFFKFVTMSTVQRTLSQNPNQTPKDADVVQPPPPPAAPAKAEDPKEAASDTQEDDDEEGYW